MRPGEVFGLIWDDIDFVNKTITVNRQVQWYAGKRTEEEKRGLMEHRSQMDIGISVSQSINHIERLI